jgi:hypothetical protein
VNIIVQHRSKSFVFARAGSLAICLWRGHIAVASLSEAMALAGELVARYGRITLLFIVRISRTSAMPEPGVDVAIAEAAARLAPHLVGSASVIEASGAGAAIAHGLRMRALPNLTAPSAAFSTAAAALSFIARLPGQAPDLQAAASLSVELELLGRGDEDEGGAQVLPFPRGRRAG